VIDLIKKTMMAGIGFALKTRDEVEELARDLAQKGTMSEQEGRRFIDDLLKRYDDARGKLENRIENIVKEFLKKEIRELKKTIRNGSEPNNG